MDPKREMKFLGFFGVLKETFKLIFSHKKLFAQITAAFIIPLSLIFQANVITSHSLSSNVFEDQKDSSDRSDLNIYFFNLNLSGLKSYKWAAYAVSIEIAYYILILIFSLLSTSSVAYSIFCKYSAKDVTFKKATSILPQIWKKVLLTYLVCFGIVFLYEYVLGAILVWMLRLLSGGVLIIACIVVLFFFLAGSVFLSIIWHLGIVVSVMEANISGVRALKRSKKLIKGKLGVAVGMLIVFGVCSQAIDAIFETFAVRDDLSLTWGIRIGVGILCFILQLLVILFGLVVQTVIYFACKSCLNEDFEFNDVTNAAAYVPQPKELEVQERLPV